MSELAALPRWALDAGAAVFIGLTIVAFVIRGWLVPGRTVERLVEAERAAAAVQRERADEWRDVARTAQALAETYGAQTAALTAEMTTQTALIRSLREVAARRRDTS